MKPNLCLFDTLFRRLVAVGVSCQMGCVLMVPGKQGQRAHAGWMLTMLVLIFPFAQRQWVVCLTVVRRFSLVVLVE